MQTTLRDRLATGPILLAPGIYDALTALLAEQAGFELLFLSGSALAYAGLGRPDIGLLTADELVDACARIADRVATPILVDADSGYGSVATLQRLVRQLERAGAAAIQIEDQAGLKPAGALQSRPLVSTGEMVGRIKAALDARASNAVLVSARTDAMASAGFDEALRRGDAYVDAGCDLLFVEGLTEAWQLDALTRTFAASCPLVHNLLEGGRSPAAGGNDLDARGFRVALFPGAVIGTATVAIRAALTSLRANATTTPIADAIATSTEMNELLGTAELLGEASRYADRRAAEQTA